MLRFCVNNEFCLCRIKKQDGVELWKIFLYIIIISCILLFFHVYCASLPPPLFSVIFSTNKNTVLFSCILFFDHPPYTLEYTNHSHFSNNKTNKKQPRESARMATTSQLSNKRPSVSSPTSPPPPAKRPSLMSSIKSTASNIINLASASSPTTSSPTSTSTSTTTKTKTTNMNLFVNGAFYILWNCLKANRKSIRLDYDKFPSERDAMLKVIGVNKVSDIRRTHSSVFYGILTQMSFRRQCIDYLEPHGVVKSKPRKENEKFLKQSSNHSVLVGLVDMIVKEALSHQAFLSSSASSSSSSSSSASSSSSSTSSVSSSSNVNPLEDFTTYWQNDNDGWTKNDSSVTKQVLNKMHEFITNKMTTLTFELKNSKSTSKNGQEYRVTITTDVKSEYIHSPPDNKYGFIVAENVSSGFKRMYCICKNGDDPLQNVCDANSTFGDFYKDVHIALGVQSKNQIVHVPQPWPTHKDGQNNVTYSESIMDYCEKKSIPNPFTQKSCSKKTIQMENVPKGSTFWNVVASRAGREFADKIISINKVKDRDGDCIVRALSENNSRVTFSAWHGTQNLNPHNLEHAKALSNGFASNYGYMGKAVYFADHVGYPYTRGYDHNKLITLCDLVTYGKDKFDNQGSHNGCRNGEIKHDNDSKHFVWRNTDPGLKEEYRQCYAQTMDHLSIIRAIVEFK